MWWCTNVDKSGLTRCQKGHIRVVSEKQPRECESVFQPKRNYEARHKSQPRPVSHFCGTTKPVDNFSILFWHNNVNNLITTTPKNNFWNLKLELKIQERRRTEPILIVQVLWQLEKYEIHQSTAGKPASLVWYLVQVIVSVTKIPLSKSGAITHSHWSHIFSLLHFKWRLSLVYLAQFSSPFYHDA